MTAALLTACANQGMALGRTGTEFAQEAAGGVPTNEGRRQRRESAFPVPGHPVPAVRPDRSRRQTQEAATGAQAAEATPGSAYEGPPRWGFHENTLRAAQWARSRDGLAQWKLADSLVKETSLSSGHKPSPGRPLWLKVQVLHCTYMQPEGAMQKIQQKPAMLQLRFWMPGNRLAVGYTYTDSGGVGTSDTERDVCPADAVQALQAAYGEGVNAKIDETFARYAQADKDAREEGQYGDVPDWAAWEKAPVQVSAARERELVAVIEAALTELEGLGRRRVTESIFKKAMHGKISPALRELAASGLAQSQKISKGPSGWKEFAAWDDGIGFTVMSLLRRNQAIWPELFGTSPLAPKVYNRYVAIYREQIGKNGAMEPKYFQQIISSAEKLRNPVVRMPSPVTVEYQVTNRVVYLRPGQVVAYQTVDAAGAAFQAWTATRARWKAYVAELNAELRQTRQELWECYAKRCTRGGELFVRMSALLRDRDIFFIGKMALEGTVAHSSGRADFGRVATDLLGMGGEIDGGYTPGCEYAYESFLAPFVTLHKTVLSNPANGRAYVQEQLNGQAYLELQRCRDTMEFILRPRAK